MLIPTRKPDPQPSWSQRGDGERSLSVSLSLFFFSGSLSFSPCSPVEPLHYCPSIKGVLWGNIPLALPQPASSLNSLEKHSSSPALAFTGISWGAFLKPCPSPRRTPRGCIPAALSFSLSPISLALPCSLSQAPAFLRSPALVQSIAPIASGTRGNPYPCAPLAHCSGHGLSARKGVIPLPDGRETMVAIDRSDM